MKPKIFCYALKYSCGDILAVALAEDGTCLATHLCSSPEYISHDLGLTSNWQHEAYTAYYGANNYELELVPMDKVDSHEGIKKALTLNEAKYHASLNSGS